MNTFLKLLGLFGAVCGFAAAMLGGGSVPVVVADDDDDAPAEKK